MVTNILLSSAGRRVSLLELFRSRLSPGHGSVIAIDSSDLSAAGHSADRFVVVPRVDSDEYVPSVIEICQHNQVNLLVPLIDTELEIWGEEAASFYEHGILVNVSGEVTLGIASDKYAFAKHLASHHLEGPDTFLLGDVPHDLDSGAIILKPRFGSSSIGLYRLTNPTQLEVVMQLISGGPEYVVQREAIGQEVSVDLFVARDGSLKGCVVRESLELRAGEVSKAKVVELPEVVEATHQLVATLPDAFGVLHLDAFFDPMTGRTQFLELNARFSGGYPLSDAAGAPFISWLLALAEGIEPDYVMPDITYGKTMLRYDEAVYY